MKVKISALFGALAITILDAAIASAQLPQFGHVIFVNLEDHSYSEAVATSDGIHPVCPPPANAPMPYLQSLICSNGLATDSYADQHNTGHFIWVTGQFVTTNSTYVPGQPMSCSNSSAAACANGGLGYQTMDNIALEAQNVGKTWKSYGECMPYVGYTGGSTTCPNNGPRYIDYHVPLSYFTNINTAQDLVPFEDPNVGFAHDLTSGTLPNFSYVTPNGCHTGRDATYNSGNSSCYRPSLQRHDHYRRGTLHRGQLGLCQHQAARPELLPSGGRGRPADHLV